MILGMQNSAAMSGDEIGNRSHYTLPGQQPGTTEKQNRSLHCSNQSFGASGNYRTPVGSHELGCAHIDYNRCQFAYEVLMNRCPRALFLGVCLLSICAFAQENRIIRVGVPTMENRSQNGVPGNLERDRLVAALNQEKPDKKLHVKVQGVPLDGTSPEAVGAEAKEKSCDYLVYTTLTELQTSTSSGMPRPGAIPPNPGNPTIPGNPNGGWNPANNPTGRANNPEYRATVEYRLYRIGSPDALSEAPVSAQQMMPDVEVVGQVMNQIARRVFADVKKAPPPAQQ